MASSSVVAMPSMKSALGKRAGGNGKQFLRGKSLVASAVDRNSSNSNSEAPLIRDDGHRPPGLISDGNSWSRGTEKESFASHLNRKLLQIGYAQRQAQNAGEGGGGAMPVGDPKKGWRFAPPAVLPQESGHLSRASKIFSVLRTEEKEPVVTEERLLLESPADLSERIKDEQNVAQVEDVPVAPTIYGRPIEYWKLKVIQKKKEVALDRAKRAAELRSENEYMSLQWRRRNIHLICEQAPRLSAIHLVKLLNSQITWLGNWDISTICNHLLSMDQYNQAYRVYKWATQRPWFVLDFDLTCRMCELMANTGRTGRAGKLYNLMISNAFVPKDTSYAALVKSLLPFYIDDAWTLYHRMVTFGQHKPTPNLLNTMFKYLTESGRDSLGWVDRAEAIVNKMVECGYFCSTEMYESLIVLWAVKGEEVKVQALVDDLLSQSRGLTPVILGAIIRVCSKTGNYQKAEEVFEKLEGSDEEFDWHYKLSLMEAYGKAGMCDKAMDIFNSSVSSPTTPKYKMFRSILKIMAAADQVATTEKILGMLQPKMQGFYQLQDGFNAVAAMYLRLGMFDKVESTLARFKQRGYHPNRDAHNLQLQALVDSGQLDKAEQLYRRMINREALKPNYKTHSIMLGAYGKAQQKAKVIEIFKLITSYKLPIPDEFQHIVDAMVKPSWLERAKSYIIPRLTQTQRRIIAGVLLGGAKMIEARKELANIHFEQEASSYRGQILIKNLHQHFSDWAVADPKLVEEDSSRVYFRTSNDIKLAFYWKQYRPNGVPVIPRLVHRWLSDLTLAYWYMYGGRRSDDGGAIILDCGAYSKSELAFVVEALHNRKIRCNMVKKGQSEDRYDLVFAGQSARWLWRLMSPHIVQELIPLLQPDAFEGERASAVQLEVCPSRPNSGGETDSDSDSESASESEEQDAL